MASRSGNSLATDFGPSRYSSVAIAFHWIIAVLLIVNLVAGLFVLDPLLHSSDPATKQLGFLAIQLHKSTGILVLVLALARLAWRLTHTPPAYPAHMDAGLRAAAKLSHWGFYALMILLPLSGWAMASTGKLIFPIMFYGLFEVPHLPLPQSMGGLFHESHEILGWIAVAMIALHVAAALKHHYLDRDDVFSRMWLWSRRT